MDRLLQQTKQQKVKPTLCMKLPKGFWSMPVGTKIPQCLTLFSIMEYLQLAFQAILHLIELCTSARFLLAYIHLVLATKEVHIMFY